MQKFGLDQHATLRSFPSGTGTMIEAFRADEIDVGVGLTEAWVTGLTKTPEGEAQPYRIIGSYTESPLLWAVSTGGQRGDINDVTGLKDKKVGISRIGSGSHVMASVLAQNHGWLNDKLEMPFETVVCGPFKPLRDAVNNSKADFFMWEHFTSKKFYDSGELKRIGEIETPWNAWQIVTSAAVDDSRIQTILLPAIEQGVKHFEEHKDEAVEFISTTMEYSKEDAAEWYKRVQFSRDNQMGQFNASTMQKTLLVLEKAGVLGKREVRLEDMRS